MVNLYPRHGTMIHAHKAYVFWVLVFGLLVIYSLGLLVYGALRPKRRFRYNVPVWLLVVAWTACCAIGLFIHPGHDFVAYVRRFGRLSIAAAVFGIFLSFKPAVLPRTYSIPLTQIHKWVGRTAVLFAFLHGVFYTAIYISRGVFGRLFRPMNLAGIFACFGFCVIGLTSIKPVRRRAYKLFYTIHVIFVWLSFFAIFYHASPNAYLMVIFAIGLLVGQIWSRLASTKTVQVKVQHITSTFNLVTVDRSALPATFEIGSHLRLSMPLHLPKTWLEPSHPYTIASLPEDDEIHLVVRRTRFELQSREYAIAGPFHAPLDISEFARVIVIAGGSGFALLPPITRRASQLGIEAKAVWVVKTDAETSVLDHLPVDKCSVYITGESQYDNDTSQPQPIPDEELELEDLAGDGDREGLLDRAKPSRPRDGITKHFQGRPSIDDLVEGFYDPSSATVTGVIACGPETLTRDVQVWANSRGCTFFAETFAI